MSPKPMDLSHHFSKPVKKRLPNVLKEYYRFLRIPGMANLAGGLPFPASFPFEYVDISLSRAISTNTMQLNTTAEPASEQPVRIPRTSNSILKRPKIDLNTALQYGSAQGYPPLYVLLRKLVKLYHPNIPYHGDVEIMINGGSADGLSKIYELLYDSWDRNINDIQDRQGLIVESFVYAPPIVQIAPKDVNVVPVEMDAEGMRGYGLGSLFDVLENWDLTKGKRPHAVYLIPTGQNPTSGVLSLSRRKEIYEICSKFDLIIIEDDPYFHLSYPPTEAKSRRTEECADPSKDKNRLGGSIENEETSDKSVTTRFLNKLVPSFLSIDTDGRVIRLDSFSKSVAPGCRLGWITAQPSICEQLFRITDGTTQQPSGFVQSIVAQMLSDSGWGLEGWIQHLETLRDTYQRRMLIMANVFGENAVFVTSSEQRTEMFSFTRPMGGMFLWIRFRIQNHILAKDVSPKRLMLALWILCTQEPYRVLCVPGGDFAANNDIADREGFMFLRFCFAAVDEDILETKSRSFVEACKKFWCIREVEEVDHILQEEDALKSKFGGMDAGLEADRDSIDV